MIAHNQMVKSFVMLSDVPVIPVFNFYLNLEISKTFLLFGLQMLT